MRFWGGVLLAIACSGAATARAAEDGDLDSLFDVGPKPAVEAGGGGGLKLGGYADFSGAYTVGEAQHWSKLRARLELGASGAAAGIRWKLSGRAEGDAAYDLESGHYPSSVRDDQRAGLSLREAYLDFGSGDWEFRLGRQHVVWGEMVGLFFADVVSARDLREFYLPEFEALRIPQWAARAEYFAGDTHFELLWIPVPSFDKIGKPGADFFPYPDIPAGTHIKERKPSNGFDNGNWGVRASHLVGGWDLSAFYYESLDVSPTLYRTSAVPGFEFRHDRIRQLGATMSKDLGEFVLKGEAVHTRGRHFLTSDPSVANGLQASDTLDYVVGVDLPVQDIWRFNVQYFGRTYYDRDFGMKEGRDEQGMTFQVVRHFGDDLEFEFLAVSSFNREDYMLRPKLTWKFAPEWRAQFGADVFGGRSVGLFGRYDNSDRLYVELRRWF
ncbi:hypothetical protein GRF61_01245 [Azoarcus sp. TTM-91]|uniref:DUF1302 family protein n=1 Tax=Azoarcus sp. TTM-91 TaxID=2691581 RepID=UPI00145CBFD5|nr:DUF1302 family protein [Azoarcus sp. TTM-91]NMG33074.1 hypothetical protein [Azoarcus sp. TTM-91]